MFGLYCLKMMQSNKEAQTAAIVDLQTELKSLKSLMAARPGTTSISNLAGSTSNGISPRSQPNGAGLNSFGIQSQSNSLSKFNTTRPVGIPAWQLASGYNAIPSSQTSNGDPSSNQTGPTTTPSASPGTPVLGHINGSGVSILDDHNRSGPATLELHNGRQSLTEDEDDHIINSKYTTDDSIPSVNDAAKTSIEVPLSS